MEVRSKLCSASEAFVRKFAKERHVALGVAVDQIVREVVNSGGLTIIQEIRPDADAAPNSETPPPAEKKTTSWPWRHMAVGEVLSYRGSYDELRSAQKAVSALHTKTRRFITWKGDGELFVKRVDPVMDMQPPDEECPI